jgi:hypothetical protein
MISHITRVQQQHEPECFTTLDQVVRVTKAQEAIGNKHNNHHYNSEMVTIGDVIRTSKHQRRSGTHEAEEGGGGRGLKILAILHYSMRWVIWEDTDGGWLQNSGIQDAQRRTSGGGDVVRGE